VHVDERVVILNPLNKKKIVAVIDTACNMFRDDEIVLSQEIIKGLNLKKKQKVDVYAAQKTTSSKIIMKKLDGKKLDYNEIYSIIKDIVSNSLTESELAYWVSAVYQRGMTDKETYYLTKAMVETGEKLRLKGKIIADKHSIGGIAGNRTTPIIVSICASAGLVMPKSSSRAITSAAGTADTIETIARVDFTNKELEKIVNKVGACLVWGGELGLAPADDKLIQVERLLNLDPKAQLLASILSKKISVGATHVLIDIPYGKSAKVSEKEGKELGKDFIRLGKMFGLKIKIIMTKGGEPIGRGIGPVLEMRDVISVLKQDCGRPIDLEEKGVYLAGLILELCGKAKKNNGGKLALKMLKSGAALKKFYEIIKAQEGEIKNIDKKLRLSSFFYDVKAKKTGRVLEINNKIINQTARISGAPSDRKTGIYLFKHIGDKVDKNEKILRIYAQSKDKLNEGIRFFKKEKAVKVG
jgi:AMP phosphorylase